MRYITIALSKGRLAKKALEMFEHIGITCEEMKDEKTRKLIFTNEQLGLKFFLAKPSDVPTYVEYGAADIGIVGKDTILEEGRKLYEVLDLNTGKCKMCVCGPQSAKDKLQHHELIRVATKGRTIPSRSAYKTPSKRRVYPPSDSSNATIPNSIRISFAITIPSRLHSRPVRPS